MLSRLSNQKISVDQIRALIRLETALAALLLVLVYYGYDLYQKAGEAVENQATQDRRLSALRADLVVFETDNDKAKLQEELRALRAVEAPQALPSARVAAALGDTITEYAQSERLPLPGFEQVDIVSMIGEVEYPAVKFSITALGNEERLTGMLELLAEYPTAMVETLEFIRPLDEEGSSRPGAWEMNLVVNVIFR